MVQRRFAADARSAERCTKSVPSVVAVERHEITMVAGGETGRVQGDFKALRQITEGNSDIFLSINVSR